MENTLFSQKFSNLAFYLGVSLGAFTKEIDYVGERIPGTEKIEPHIVALRDLGSAVSSDEIREVFAGKDNDFAGLEIAVVETNTHKNTIWFVYRYEERATIPLCVFCRLGDGNGRLAYTNADKMFLFISDMIKEQLKSEKEGKHDQQ